MDDFDFEVDSQELATPAITINFGASGKFSQIWVGDAANPNASELQFVASQISFGDESIEDYLPGTILLAARTGPDEPWLATKVTGAEMEAKGNETEITYTLSMFTELALRGRVFSVPEKPEAICWEIQIENRSRRSIEIGELGFPFAMNTHIDASSASDESMNLLLVERLVGDRFVGGAASYLSFRRLCGDPPGLIVVPGAGSPWEMVHSAPLSIRHAPSWPGAPIVYVHSLATIEREDWDEWLYGHSSLILDPGDTNIVQILFIPMVERHRNEVALALADHGVPAFRPTSGMVVPVGTRTVMEVGGTRPTTIEVDSDDVILETESDEFGALCYLSPKKPGEFKLTVQDMDGRVSWAHFNAVKPIHDLIQARARFITKNQVQRSGPLLGAIVPHDRLVPTTPTEEIFLTAHAVRGSLADALFLAEKNLIQPSSEELGVLERYVELFLLKRVQNPSTAVVFSTLNPLTNYLGFGAPDGPLYATVASFYLAMKDLTEAEMINSSYDYQDLSERTVAAMMQYADPSTWAVEAIPGASRLYRDPEFSQVRGRLIGNTRLPFWQGNYFSTAALEEVAAFGRAAHSVPIQNSAEQIALTHKSSAANWWSYGAEVRPSSECYLHPYLDDQGQISPSPWTIHTARILATSLETESNTIDEAALRLLAGAMNGIWGLVGAQGDLIMGACDDMASAQYGKVPWSGDMGFALAEYVRTSTVYVLTSEEGVICIGGSVTLSGDPTDPALLVEPHDGVGRRIVFRKRCIEVSANRCRISRAVLPNDSRTLSVEIHNDSLLKVKSRLEVKGLWGTRLSSDFGKVELSDGGWTIGFELAPGQTATVSLAAS